MTTLPRGPAIRLAPSDPARYEAFLEGMSDAVVVCDQQGRIDFVNRQTELVTGYQRDELRGKRVETLIPNDLRSRHLGHFEQYSEHPTIRGMGSQLDIKLRRKDGTDVPVDIALSPVDTGDGLHFVAVVRAMPERVRIQAKAKNEADAEVARAKNELLSTVSHEMRTPLASIVGFTELLVTRNYSRAQRLRYLDIMLQEEKRLTDLINDFLDLQRMEDGHFQLKLATIDLGALVKRAVANALEDPRTPITIRFPKQLPLVVADTDSILQVLTNLLSNARKYSPEGGEITVKARHTAGSVEVSVEDRGLGIRKEDLPKLFHKFYRSDEADVRKIQGTGLGLAISRRIVEAHGGRIEAKSEGPGKGATFQFTLPSVVPSHRTADVLLVEDDSGFAKLMEAELETNGLSTIWAPEAETAERLIDQGAARAVVLDLVLPGIQGEEFLIGLRASRGSSIPVVIVTMKPLGPDEKAALHASGAIAVLGKHSGGAKAAAVLLADALKAPRKVPS